MSMDIRSFFGASPPSRISKPSESEKKKKKQTKKKVIISDSESEDDDNKKKKKSPAKHSPSKSPKSLNNKAYKNILKPGEKVSVTNTMSKYFNMKPIKPSDVFGSAPVKRVPALKKDPSTTSKKSYIDISDVDEFDAMLMQLADEDVDTLVKEADGFIDSEENKSSVSSKEKDVTPLKKKINEKLSMLKKDSVSKADSESEIMLNGKSKKSSTSVSLNVKNGECNKKRTSAHTVAGTKNYCIDLSESDSDSDTGVFTKEKLVNNWKSLVNGDKLMPNMKHKITSPTAEKKKVEEKQKKGAKTSSSNSVVKPKNTCIDLSESDDDDELEHQKLSSKTKAPSPMKRELQPKELESTRKKQKVDERENKAGQKRKLEDESMSQNKKAKSGDSPSVDSKGIAGTSKVVKQSPIKQVVFDRPAPMVSSLWVDKYKPTTLKQLIGQQGPQSNVNKLLNWLSKWKSNHSGNTKHQRPSPWAKNDDGAFFKAALLSGPPGIGKTTTAHLVCKELGYDVVEFNASDTRSKKLLHEEVSELLSSKSLAPYFTGGGDEVTRNHVLLMDEVDGMAGNEDRGGVQELIQLVKSARVPVVCMCNDRNHPKMRSLVNYCYDLRFNRPRVEQIKGAMMSICYKEGLKVQPDSLTDIIKSTNQDIRLILNHLSVLAANKDSALPNSEKFIKLGPWDVLRKVFSEEELKQMSFNDKSDLFFHDYSIAPLFVHENFLNVVPHAKLNKREKMEAFAKAADSLCQGDIIEKVIRSKNAWSLLPVQAVFSSVVPGETLKGHLGGQINFPAWFGKNSTKTKMDRLQQELLVHTRLKVSASKEAINIEYSNHLRDLIVRPLIEHGSEGVAASLEALQSYDLLKEDLESLSELCKWPGSKDPMVNVESKVKAAFTRAYNKSSAPSPYSVSSVIKKGRGGATAVEEEPFGEEEEESERLVAEEGEKEDEDSIEVDAMISVKKKAAAKKQEPSSSKQQGGGAGRGTGKKGKGRGK